jgi:hypothetical protein
MADMLLVVERTPHGLGRMALAVLAHHEVLRMRLGEALVEP